MDKEVLWIRTEATDSQIEGILKQRNSLITKVKRLRESLDDIVGICVNYDGYSTVDGLKGLIDDIQDYARKARDGEPTRLSHAEAKIKELEKP